MNGNLAMLLAADGSTALTASGTFLFEGGDFANASATLVTVNLNDSTTDYAATPLTITIDGVSAELNAGLGVQSVSVWSSDQASFQSAVTSASVLPVLDIEVAANEVFAQLEAGDFQSRCCEWQPGHVAGSRWFNSINRFWHIPV